MMEIKYKGISLPKAGNSKEENEDSFSVPKTGMQRWMKTIRCSKPFKFAFKLVIIYIVEKPDKKSFANFAISDGATESSFSKEWASLLVSEYNNKGKDSFEKKHLQEMLKRISKKWHSKVYKGNLPWYAEEKLKEGAFATFLGLTVHKEKWKFDAVAIGDCALFLVRKDELIFSFPVKSYQEFGNTPNLFASNLDYQPDIESSVSYTNHDLCPGDVLLLTTDALAAWFLKCKEAGGKPWHTLAKALEKENSEKAFSKWLERQRQAYEMKNDDVTLIQIKIKE
ncbi:hypothetical protein FACS189435_3380 [Bacteroidia bacterium]|nr:hypothetical protein FACS189435_3380 [Bacteroidia bacterium]